MKMFAVGCSHGNDATAWDTKILDPKVTMTNTETRQSFSEIKCMNQPKEGRSGGGLYTQDGYVAGVCDFADPNEHVGLYAVPEAIHRMLDRKGLTALYKPVTDRPGTMLAGATAPRPAPSPNTRLRAQSPAENEPGAMRTASTAANQGDITIPPPSMVGIKSPRTPSEEPGAGTWRRNPPGLARANRPARRLDNEGEATAIDPGPILAEHGGEANSEARAFEDIEARAPRQPTSEPPVVRPNTPGKWRPVRPASPTPIDRSPSGR